MRGHWIGGRSVRGSRTMQIVNPATLKRVDVVGRGGAREIDLAVQAARAAWGRWKKLPGVEKAGLMHEAARRTRARKHALARLMTLETGKPLIESYDEVEWVAACLDYYGEIGRHSRGNSIPPVAEHQINFTVKEPLGVVGCIVPFNYPLLLMIWKVAPAVAAGNCVVIKPADETPVATLEMAKAFDGFPPGVINIVSGLGEEAGDALVRHRDVAMIAFTGSTEVGRRIAALAAENLKRVNLELGGIDPLIVCEDADLDVAVRGAAWARFLNAGQVCTSAKRIFAVKPIAAEFTKRLVAYAKSLRVGDPMNPKTDVGPLISKPALERVEAQVASALGEGARLLCGGQRAPGRGWYYKPTVLANVSTTMRVVTEEVFGPVACVMTPKNVDEAIRLADASDYGLGANIYTKNLEYATRAMENIKAGTFWVNDPLTDNDAGPFGGMRKSGIGRELGEEGLDTFRETKHVHLDYVQERKSYWFPYAKRPLPRG